MVAEEPAGNLNVELPGRAGEPAAGPLAGGTYPLGDDSGRLRILVIGEVGARWRAYAEAEIDPVKKRTGDSA